MSNELNEPYNNTIIPRQNYNNAILNTRRKHARLKGDSGASSHFTREEDQHCLENVVNATGPMITMPDAGTLQANKHGTLPLPSILSSAATIATIVPGLKFYSMLSLGQLCGNGCNVLLNKQKMYAIKDKEVVIEGERNHRDGLREIFCTIKPQRKNECPNQK